MEYRELKPDTPWKIRREVHQLERERDVLTYKSMLLVLVIMALAVAFSFICLISIMK